MTRPLAILYDADDAACFAAARPDARNCLALTPDAAAILRKENTGYIPACTIYGPFAHRRALARVRKAKRAINPAFDRLPEAAGETARSLFDLTAHMAARVHETLKGNGPWLFPQGTGWQSIEDRGEAEHTLLSRLSYAPWWRLGAPQTRANMIGLINNGVAAIIARHAPAIFTNFDRGFGPLHRSFLETEKDARAVSFVPSAGGLRDAARSGQALLQALSGKPALRLSCPALEERSGLTDDIGQIFKGVTDPVIARGLTVFGQDISAEAAAADGMARYLTGYLPRLKPRAVLSYSFRWRLDAALGAAAGRAGIKRSLLSHGSHGKADGAVSAAAIDDHARGLLVSPLTDRAYTQSPHADAAAARLAPDQKREPVQPVVWGFQRARKNTGKTGPFRILQAGTPKSWRDHRPWMYETSDEYVAGLTALIQAVDAMETEAELVIRVREQAECSLAALETLLPKSPRATVKTSGGFLDDLATADLLVSHSSTTIEEALAAHVSVLLWGGGCPYRHLPANETPPTRSDKSAVYAIAPETEPAAMLNAIAMAHGATPLSSDEIASHIWPDDTQGAKDLIDQLCALKTNGAVAARQTQDAGTVPRTTT